MKAGILYLCPTPLGNLEDITLRVLRILKEVDLIAAEETDHTQKLLWHYEIKKPLVSYTDVGPSESREERLIQKLLGGESIALVTSAGTPLISDPGFRLVKKCLEREIPVVPLPGPSAAITALVASGLPAHQFFFAGFLPSKSNARRAALEKLKSLSCTLILYEAPHRITESLEDCLAILGDRQAALARELTKLHEEVIRLPLSRLLPHVQEKSLKGEITLVVGGAEEDLLIDWEEIREEAESLLEKGVSPSETSRKLAKKYAVPKNTIYALVHRHHSRRASS